MLFRSQNRWFEPRVRPRSRFRDVGTRARSVGERDAERHRRAELLLAVDEREDDTGGTAPDVRLVERERELEVLQEGSGDGLKLVHAASGWDGESTRVREVESFEEKGLTRTATCRTVLAMSVNRDSEGESGVPDACAKTGGWKHSV